MCLFFPNLITNSSLAVHTLQVGWAAVQITHLAMMNDLTLEPGERTLLTSLRYLFTVLSNLAVYLCTFFLLHHAAIDPRPHNGTEPLNSSYKPSHFEHHPVVGSHPLQNDVDFGADDLPAFRNLSLAIIAVGGLVTVIFHLCVRASDFLVVPPVTGPTETSKLVLPNWICLPKWIHELGPYKTIDCFPTLSLSSHYQQGMV